MNSVLFDLGIIKIKWYSFFILLAVLTASIIIGKEVKKRKLDEDDFINIIFYGLISGILGARLYYVFFILFYYLNNLKEILMVWNGGLAIHGGIISALIFLLIYTKKKKINLLLLLDTIVIGLIIAQAIGRWGNFFNQEAFGRIISKNYLQSLYLPKFIIDGMYIDGYYREPTFLYESGLSTIGFIVLILLRNIKKIKTGYLTSVYLIWYGLSRLIIETFRSDSLMLGQFKIAQIVSIIGIISGIVLIYFSSKNNNIYIYDKIYLCKKGEKKDV